MKFIKIDNFRWALDTIEAPHGISITVKSIGDFSSPRLLHKRWGFNIGRGAGDTRSIFVYAPSNTEESAQEKINEIMTFLEGIEE